MTSRRNALGNPGAAVAAIGFARMVHPGDDEKAGCFRRGLDPVKRLHHGVHALDHQQVLGPGILQWREERTRLS